MPLTHKPSAQSGVVPLLYPGDASKANVFLGGKSNLSFSRPSESLTSPADLVATKDETAPIAAGLFRMEKGKPLVYNYTYDEAKIILEGECSITDEEGTTVIAKPGDVFLFPKGTTITFESQDYLLAFYVGQRPQL
ncbi:RmlC-like cupin domain-containing protein [Cercophora scortea]|uniref:RmlC-like cupin domain-containing protein n=1 Tax=Cercophora scortea TaxID=314031 RepID=A0AAE0MCS4_9PEZI|nr:RmlC-like cupin domain-containing protein [Cercophora scortea]